VKNIWRHLGVPMLLVLAPAAAAQERDGDTAGPFVTSPVMLDSKSGSVTVSWIERGPDVTVRQGQEVQTNFPLQVHMTTFSHLKPGTTYSYKAGSVGGGTFKTSPRESQPFEFLIYAESRNGAVVNTIEQQDKTIGDDVHSQVIAAMSRENPDFVMHLGDAVQTGSDQQQWFDFFRIGAPLFRKTNLALVYGNHEANAPLVHELFNQPKTYYSFDWGRSHFIVLDSEYDRIRLPQAGKSTDAEQEALWQEQMTWLKQELEANKGAENVFVAFHLPAFTATAYKRRDRSFRIQKEWVPLFEQYGAIVLNGHEHNYQRHENKGVHYFVAGSAGASLEKVDWPIPGVTKRALAQFSYVKFKVDGRRVSMAAFDLKGKKIDEAVIR
jgi:acid phosphatase type 7